MSDSCPQPRKVTVPVCDGHFKASSVFNVVVSSLGLKKQSTDYFTLCEGLVYPKRRYIADENIPENVKELSFQKWMFNVKQERQLMKHDEIAGHLIFMQAKYFIEADLLELSKEDEEQLHEYGHPDFMLEKQYTEVCQRLRGYYEYRFHKGVVMQDTTLNGIQFFCDIQLQLRIKTSGLQITHGTKNLHFDWTSVKCWQLLPDKEIINYTIETNSELSTVSLQTDRVLYMLAVTKEMINLLQASDPSSPRFYSHMITTQTDGSTIWQNALFKYKNT